MELEADETENCTDHTLPDVSTVILTLSYPYTIQNYIYTYIHTHAYIHIYMHIYTLFMYVCMYAHMCVCAYASMCVCAHELRASTWLSRIP